ncbi:unnamed protein product, partial [Heterosigma akashiwo]
GQGPRLPASRRPRAQDRGAGVAGCELVPGPKGAVFRSLLHLRGKHGDGGCGSGPPGGPLRGHLPGRGAALRGLPLQLPAPLPL